MAERLHYSGITFPVTIKQISQIERQNEININVFGYKGAVYPIRISKERYDDHIELLYIEKEEKQHYVYIKDFNRLMFNFTKHKERKHFCMHCLQCSYSNDDLEKHRENCIVINGVQSIELPKPYIDKNGVEKIPSVYFKNHHKQLPVSFVIYADFESITQKIMTCQPSDKKSYTQTYQRHTACSFGYKVVCHYDKKYSKLVVTYRGPDAVYKFLVSMLLEVQDLQKVIRKNFKKPLILTGEEEEFQRSTHCWICDKKYSRDHKPVRDHCHITGKYRGSAHDSCNLKLQITAEKIKTPVIFHNLKGYDSHLIMQEIGQIIQDENEKISEENKIRNDKKFIPYLDLNVIAQNAEKIYGFLPW